MLSLWVWIAAHCMKWHLRDGERQCLVEIHIFDKAIRIEEIISLPMCRKRGERGATKFRVNLLAASKDDIFIVQSTEQGGYASILGVAATLPLKWPSLADTVIAICQIAWR